MPDLPGRGVRAVLAAARAVREPDIEVLALDGLARCSAVAGDLPAATELLSAADDLMPAAAYALAELDRLDARQARVLLGVPAG